MTDWADYDTSTNWEFQTVDCAWRLARHLPTQQGSGRIWGNNDFDGSIS